MSWVRLGKILGVLVGAFVLFLITISDSPLRAPVIAVAALVVLVAAGNWLNDWFGVKRKPPEFEHLPSPDGVEGEPEVR